MSPSSPSTHVAVAIGNSTLQLATFRVDQSADGHLERIEKSAVRDDGCQRFIDQLPRHDCCWHVASVYRDAERRLAALVASQRPADVYRVLSHADVPLQIKADHPDRVGMDRLAAAVAANHLRGSSQPALVVDVGTAVTVNLLNAEGHFLGGAILPGFSMAASALTAHTDLLPLVPVSPHDQPPAVLGCSTEKAIRSGLFWGTLGAVRELTSRMANDHGGTAELFITGGGGEYLARLLDEDATFVPHLVLNGIALIACQADQRHDK